MKRIAMVLGAAALVLSIVPATVVAATPTQSIVQIATANGNFKTLLAAVGCADPAVGKALTGTGPLTVFAPTDKAFAKKGLTAANVCHKLPKAALTSVLLYHVVSGSNFAKDVLPAKGKIAVLETVLGQQLAVNAKGRLFTTGSTMARILIPQKLYDIPATNGVIHVIDAVLMPAL